MSLPMVVGDLKVKMLSYRSFVHSTIHFFNLYEDTLDRYKLRDRVRTVFLLYDDLSSFVQPLTVRNMMSDSSLTVF